MTEQPSIPKSVVEEEPREWWEEIEQSLSDACAHFSDYTAHILFDELEHLYATRDEVNKAMIECQEQIIKTVKEEE